MGPATPPNPDGWCECGCGRETAIAQLTDRRRGDIKGEHRRFCKGHHGRKAVRWIEEDRGHETTCWIWQLTILRSGYGQVQVDNVVMLAHRWSYEKHVGDIPGGLTLDHLCRQRDCVNPAHLEPVTQTENNRRGRATKLTLVQAREIKDLVAAGELSQTEIGRQYDVSQASVSLIAAGINWPNA